LIPVLLAQKDRPENLPKFDRRPLHFGFQLGLSSNGFRLSSDITQNDSVIGLLAKSQPGFNIHIVSELHLGSHFGLRFLPGIAFAARDLEYRIYTRSGVARRTDVRTIESTFVEFPLLFKYRSKRVNNFAQYVMVGGSYNIDLASQKKVKGSKDEFGNYIVKLEPITYNLEVGVGFDFFMEYFKFAPELRFSYGLNNAAIYENNIYASPIKDLRSRIFVLALNFEG